MNNYRGTMPSSLCLVGLFFTTTYGMEEGTGNVLYAVLRGRLVSLERKQRESEKVFREEQRYLGLNQAILWEELQCLQQENVEQQKNEKKLRRVMRKVVLLGKEIELLRSGLRFEVERIGQQVDELMAVWGCQDECSSLGDESLVVFPSSRASRDGERDSEES